MGDDLKIVRDWLLKLPDLDLEDIVADGGVTSGMVVQQEAALMASKLSAILARAQGPGPGEAVAWRYRHVPYVGWSYASTKPLRTDLEVEPLYAATPTREA